MPVEESSPFHIGDRHREIARAFRQQKISGVEPRLPQKKRWKRFEWRQKKVVKMARDQATMVGAFEADFTDSREKSCVEITCSGNPTHVADM